MLRALKVLVDAAPRHGWELTLVLSAEIRWSRRIGLPPERIAYLPGLRGWRRWSGPASRSRSTSPVWRAWRATPTSSTPARCRASRLLVTGRTLARRPQVVHVYSSYEDGGDVPEALPRTRAARDRALGRFARVSPSARSAISRRRRAGTSSTTEWTSSGSSGRQRAPVPVGLPPPAGRASAWWGTSTRGRTRRSSSQAAAAIRAAHPGRARSSSSERFATPPTRRRSAGGIGPLGLAGARARHGVPPEPVPGRVAPSTCWRTPRAAIRSRWRSSRAWRFAARSSRRRSAAFPRCSSTARAASWCRQTTRRPWPRRSCRCSSSPRRAPVSATPRTSGSSTRFSLDGLRGEDVRRLRRGPRRTERR